MATDIEDAAPVLDGSAETPDLLFLLEDQRISTVVIGQRQPGRAPTDDDQFSAPHNSVSAVQPALGSDGFPVLLLFWPTWT